MLLSTRYAKQDRFIPSTYREVIELSSNFGYFLLRQVIFPDFFLADQLTSQVSYIKGFFFYMPHASSVQEFTCNLDPQTIISNRFRCKHFVAWNSTFAITVGETISIDRILVELTLCSTLSALS